MCLSMSLFVPLWMGSSNFWFYCICICFIAARIQVLRIVGFIVFSITLYSIFDLDPAYFFRIDVFCRCKFPPPSEVLKLRPLMPFEAWSQVLSGAVYRMRHLVLYTLARNWTTHQSGVGSQGCKNEWVGVRPIPFLGIFMAAIGPYSRK